MKGPTEFLFYLSVSIGMALATSSFYIFSGLFEATTLSWILIALVASGLFLVVLAFSIGELAGLYPSAPAIRTYFKTAFSNRTSLILIYLYLIFIVILSGVESYIFALVVHALFPQLHPVPTILVLLGTVIVTNLLGLELPRGAQMVTTFGLLFIIFAVGIFGLVHAPGAARSGFTLGPVGSGIGLLPAAMGLAVFLYTGFEWVTPVGLRPSAYERKIPLTMPVALAALVLTYGFFAVGLAANLSRHRIAGALAPHVPYFGVLMGRPGRYLAGVLSLLATYSTFNAGVMGGSRLVYVMAREGNLPKWCARLNLKTGAATGAVLFLGACAVVDSMLIVVFHLQLLAAVVGAAIVCLVYAGYMLAVINLRRLAPDRRRPFRTPVRQSIQWAVFVVFLLISVATLFSLPGQALRATIGMAIAVLIALQLTRWSLRRTATEDLATARAASSST